MKTLGQESLWESEAMRNALHGERGVIERVSRDPEVMDGLPVIKGTRIPVYAILEQVEAGHDTEEILRSYPALCEEDIAAAIRFASLVTAVH